MIQVVLDNKTINVLEAYKEEDVKALIDKVSEEISWRFTHDYNNGKRFNHYFANYPIALDTESTNGYNSLDCKKFLTNKEMALKLEECKQLEYNKQLKKLKNKEKAENKALCIINDIKKHFVPVSHMYIWMMAFGTNDTVIIGRTKEQLRQFMDALTYAFNLGENRSLIIYVHSLKFDWSFIRNDFAWVGNNKRKTLINDKIVYYCMTSGFWFKDSLALSGTRLEKINDLMEKYGDKCHKLSGYDYEKPRLYSTPLTNDELAYCICDVLTLTWYIREKMEEKQNTDEKGPNILKIRNTLTGEIRRECKDRLYYSTSLYHSKNDWKYKKHSKLVEDLKIDLELYNQIKRAFNGGYTHANRIHVGKIFKNEVFSCDITSSYAAQIVMCDEFPMGPYEFVGIPENKTAFNNYISNYSCLFDVVLYDVRPKIKDDVDFDYIDNIISIHKAEQYGKMKPEWKPIWPEEERVDDDLEKKYYRNNGRIRYADRIALTVNQIDWRAICTFYDFDRAKTLIGNFRIAKKGYLPKDLILYALELFRVKSKNPKGSVAYKIAKVRLNSLFGMIATDTLKEDYILNDENITERREMTDEEKEEKLESQTSFLCYQWGHILTSAARESVFRIIAEGSKESHIYCDTDSEYFLRNATTKDWINNYNLEVDYKMNKCFKYYNLPKDMYKVKGPDGLQCLGYFKLDNGGKPYKKFVVCKSKAYLYEDEDGDKLTCSGLAKNAIDYLKKEYGDDLYEKFGKAEITVPAEFSGCKTAITNKDGGYMIITDYLGNTEEVYESGFCHLERTPFDMKKNKDYEIMGKLKGYTIIENGGGI